jgi:hypothetical protein
MNMNKKIEKGVECVDSSFQSKISSKATNENCGAFFLEISI